MKKYTELLETDRIYHIYNRGINGENIFKEERNYPYFLKKYSKYIEPVAETYAYCLLKNHFHVCVKILSENEIRTNLKANKSVELSTKNQINKIETACKKIDETNISILLGFEFGNFFKSYAQSINTAHNRTGGLFEKQFRRIEVNNENYLRQLISYIHRNAEKHKFVDEFKNYPHSSYNSHLSNENTKLKREEVIKLFGNKAEFEKYHINNENFGDLDKYEIEVE